MSSKKELHCHGCSRCSTRYEDCCETPAEDGLCALCRGVRTWLLLIENRRPKECCFEHSRLATKDERARYLLAGKKLWYRCSVCARTHPFKPKVDAVQLGKD